MRLLGFQGEEYEERRGRGGRGRGRGGRGRGGEYGGRGGEYGGGYQKGERQTQLRYDEKAFPTLS